MAHNYHRSPSSASSPPHQPSSSLPTIDQASPLSNSTTSETAGHRLRIDPSDNRLSSVPRDQSAVQNRCSSVDLLPTSTTTASATTSSSRSAVSSRRCSRDSDITLVASPLRPSSPFPSSSSSTSSSAHHHTCPIPSPVSMSEHTSFPPRSDSYQAPKNAVSAFPGSQQPIERRPLIDFVTNDWQKNSGAYRDGSFESTDSYSNYVTEKDLYTPPQLPEWLRRILRIQVPRRVQRYLGGYLLFALALWFGWLYWLQPAWQHEALLDESASMANSKKGQSFGVNMRPSFVDMIHLQELDATFLPGATNVDKRLVFIGDVHGCKDEFEQLLTKVGYNPSNDHLILTGDLIAKGPDSSGSVDLAMKMGASCVRGNWEDRTLLAYNTLTSKVHPLPGPAEDPNTKEDYLDEESFSHGDYKDRALAKLLSKEQIKWLKQCPVILRVGGIAGFNGGSEIAVAHAGLVPGIAYERQDPFQVMNMRSIDLKTRVPSEERKGEPWEKLWNHHQSHLRDASQRATVVYGHDSKRGLNIQKYSKGLDSGCLRGGSLTAMIIDSRGRQKIISVDCKTYKE